MVWGKAFHSLRTKGALGSPQLAFPEAVVSTRGQELKPAVDEKETPVAVPEPEPPVPVPEPPAPVQEEEPSSSSNLVAERLMPCRFSFQLHKGGHKSFPVHHKISQEPESPEEPKEEAKEPEESGAKAACSFRCITQLYI